MKVAVIYSGHLRSWKLCRQNHEECIGGDRFFFTYTDPGEGRWVEAPQDYYHYDLSHPYYGNRRPESDPVNGLNQWHNLFLAFALVPNHYDIVCRTRPDITISHRVDWEAYEYRDDCLYIPSENDYCGVNDQMAFGNYEAMKKYTSVYLNHGELFGKGYQYNPEIFIQANLKELGVEIKRISHTVEIKRL